MQYRQNPLFNRNKIYHKEPGGIRSAIPQKNQQYLNPYPPPFTKKHNRKTKSEKIPYFCMITKWMHP